MLPYIAYMDPMGYDHHSDNIPSGQLLHKCGSHGRRNNSFTHLKNGDFPVRYVTVYQINKIGYL